MFFWIFILCCRFLEYFFKFIFFIFETFDLFFWIIILCCRFLEYFFKFIFFILKFLEIIIVVFEVFVFNIWLNNKIWVGRLNCTYICFYLFKLRSDFKILILCIFIIRRLSLHLVVNIDILTVLEGWPTELLDPLQFQFSFIDLVLYHIT